MSEFGSSSTPPHDPSIPGGSQVLTREQVASSLKRVAHEIVERHPDTSHLVLIGLQRGGVPFALALAPLIGDIEGRVPPVGTLDVAFFRDDLAERPVVEPVGTSLPVELDGRVVVLVDDVLFTGRTIRAALNALAEWGRPAAIELAVMVDRGHRELPVRADYVGKNLPTSRDEEISATPDGVWLGGAK